MIVCTIFNYVGSKNINTFIILGVRPTSTLGPRRDQLVVAFKSQVIEPYAKRNSKLVYSPKLKLFECKHVSTNSFL